MNSTVHRKSQTTLSSKKGMLNPLPVYGGERQRALEDKIHESNTLLEQIKLTQWQKAYSYIEINTDQFKSVFLQQNKHFEVCLSIIQEFNEEVRKSRLDQSEIRNGPWKQKFCNQLQLLLREILFTRDRIIQKTFCEKVCTWAVDQLEQLEVAAETQLYETMESLNAKVSLTRPDSAVSAITGATNILGSRLFSASSTNLGRRPKSGVLRGLDKSLMPQLLNQTQSTMRPESAFNSSLRPESAAYYSKIDLIRPESSTNFKKIRPGSAVTFNTKQPRPISSILRPESAFIKEDVENEEPEKINKHKEFEIAIEEIEEGKKEDDLDLEIEQQLQSQFASKDQGINKLHKDRIRLDINSANLQPSQQIEQLLQDYKTKARTKIDGVEPPAERLHNYIRKKLIPDDLHKKEDPSKDNQKKDISSDYANLRWTFPKPEIFLPSQQQQLQSVDVPHEEILAGQASPQAAAGQPGQAQPIGAVPVPAAGEAQPQEGQELQQQQSGDQVEGDKLDGKAGGDEKDKEKKEVNIVPDTKNFTIDANSKETFVRNLNKKFEMRSTFTNYEPTDDLREMRMEAKWIEGRNRELNNKRQDEERIAMVKEWSLAKGRIEKEINRKIDSSVYGSKFVQCDYRPRPYTAKELRDIDKNTLTRKIANNNFFKDSQQEGEFHYEESSHQGEGFPQMHEELRGEEGESERSHQQEEQEGSEGQEDGDHDDQESGAMIAEQDNDGVDDDEEEEEMMAQLENMGVPRVGQYRGSKIAIPRMTAVIDGTKSVPVLAKADKFVNIDKNIDDMEYQISKEKISQIRKLYGATINVAKSKELEDERPDIKSTSLSVYSKDRRTHIIRPFSAVLSRVTVNHVRKDQVDEIEQVKKVLAKYNLNVQTNSIKRALLVPEGNLGVEAEILPEPGQGLFNNPFMKTKKKKKKKGKKKAKK